MDVLQEILKWSVDRPAWQRDALRRLLANGALTETDIEELAEICKHGHGLSEAAKGFKELWCPGEDLNLHLLT